MEFWVVLFLAGIIERIWEQVKRMLPVDVNDQMGTMVLGILFAFAAEADLFLMVGVELNIPYLGIVATGILFSGGSNLLHDIIDWIRGLKDTSRKEDD